MTLLADIGSGRIKDFRFRDFLLFVTFFPHLIAGPIVHHREMMPQFQRASYRLNWENLAIGFVLLTVGLFKKAVLADGIAEYVTPIFNDAAAGKPVSFARPGPGPSASRCKSISISAAIRRWRSASPAWSASDCR